MQRSTSRRTSRVAAPQCISGRTSYLHVRLAFHPYPQVIPQFCNTGEFEPRRTFTSASLCPWVAHVVSGRLVATCALFRLGFPLAPQLYRWLTRDNDSLAGSFYKRHAISPDWLLPEWPLTAGKYEVSGSLSSPSRGAFHLSLTVLVHYRSHQFLALEGGPPSFPPDYTCPVVLRVSADRSLASPTGLSPSLMLLSNSFGSPGYGRTAAPTTPVRPKPARFGLLPFRSPLLRVSRLISSRQGTEMFQFPCLPRASLWIQEAVSRHHSGGVAPFGISRLIACMQLPLNVSPVSASFIGLMRPGILLVLFCACLSVCCCPRGVSDLDKLTGARMAPRLCFNSRLLSAQLK
jgi:hypothetical protein